MSDQEGAICDECGKRVGAYGCCADVRTSMKQKAALERACEAALALIESLGGDEGYFPVGRGKSNTDALRNALRAAGYKIVYQRGTGFEVTK